MRFNLFRTRLSVFALVLLFALVGCREDETPTPEANHPLYVMSLDVEPDPPAVGETSLIFTVREERGPLIGDAVVSVRGDMNHAGMQPVFGEVDGSIDGLYRVPFEWTMAGDWILTVTVTFTDGSSTQNAFAFSVASEGEMQMDMADSEN